MNIVIISIIIILWPVFFLFPSVSMDFPILSRELLETSFNFPRAWDYRAVGLGSNSLFTLWSWPIDFLYGLFGILGFNFDFIQTVFILLTILVGSYSINLILKSYKLLNKARIAACLFYLLNSYFLLLIDGGQLNIALAYSLLPLAYFYFQKSIDNNFFSKVKAGLVVSALGFCDIRFLYLLSIILGLRFLFTLKKGALFSGLVVGLIFILLNFYWLWPVYKFGLELPVEILGNENINFLSFTQLKHGILLLQPHWYKNSFGLITATRKEFILIPIVALFGIVLNKKNKEVYFWATLSLLGIFLVKGSNPPFENFYKLLFDNIPGFFVFRDPSKFFIFISLGYSVLIAFAINKLTKFAPAVFGLFLIYLVVLVSPVYSGKMTGLFSKQENIESFKKVEQVLKEDNTFGRVLWLPYRHPLAYVSLTHPVVEGSRVLGLRPFAVGNFGLYESLNFLREGEHIPQLLNISGIEYIAYTYPDNRKRELSDDEEKYFETFSSQLSQKNYLEEIYIDEAVSLYKVKGNIDKFFIAENKVSLSGSDKIYENFSFDSIYNLKNNALIINNMRQSYFYYPSDYLSNSPNESGWWKREANEFLWLRDFLQQKYKIDNQDLSYGGGYAICEGKCRFIVPEEVKDWDKVYIRLLEISAESVTKRITGTEDILDQVFEFSDSKFIWKEIDENTEIELDSSVNIVNAISPYLPTEDSINLIAGESEAKVTFKMINPAHYKVSISNLSKPSTLIFSESFSPHWKLGSLNSYKVYDLYNGFDVTKDGEYDLYFEPQKYVNQGFVVSLISFFTLVIVIIKNARINKNPKD